MSLKKACLLLLGVSLFNGCATHVPPNKPSNQLAHVEEFKAESGARLDIIKINGTQTHLGNGIFVPTANLFDKALWTGKIEESEVFTVEPGLNILDIHYSAGGVYADGKISFNAQAGHTYAVQMKTEMKKGWLFPVECANFSVIDKQDIKPKQSRPPNQI
jgi:hypothetical protein